MRFYVLHRFMYWTSTCLDRFFYSRMKTFILITAVYLCVLCDMMPVFFNELVLCLFFSEPLSGTVYMRWCVFLITAAAESANPETVTHMNTLLILQLLGSVMLLFCAPHSLLLFPPPRSTGPCEEKCICKCNFMFGTDIHVCLCMCVFVC